MIFDYNMRKCEFIKNLANKKQKLKKKLFYQIKILYNLKIKINKYIYFFNNIYMLNIWKRLNKKFLYKNRYF